MIELGACWLSSQEASRALMPDCEPAPGGEAEGLWVLPAESGFKVQLGCLLGVRVWANHFIHSSFVCPSVRSKNIS